MRTWIGNRDGWGSVLRDRWTVLALVTLCYWSATQALRPVIAFQLDTLGASDALIGAVLGANSAVTFVLALPSGWFADRVGLRRSLTLGFVGMVLAGAGFAVIDGVIAITVVLLAAGSVELGTWVSLQSLASHAGAGERLRRQLALFSFTWGTGLAVGPAIGTWLYEHLGFASVGWMYAGSAVLAVVCASVLPFEEATDDSGAGRTRSPLKMFSAARDLWDQAPIRAVLTSSFVVLFVYGIRNSFYPLYLERAGFSVSRVGLLMTVIGLASLAIRLFLPSMLRRLGASRVLAASMWLPIVGITLTPVLGTPWLLVVAAVVVGAGLGMNPPVTVELMARHTQTATRGIAMGLRLSSNRLAQVVQPILFGVTATALGLPAAFAVGGVLLGAIATASRTGET